MWRSTVFQIQTFLLLSSFSYVTSTNPTDTSSSSSTNLGSFITKPGQTLDSLSKHDVSKGYRYIVRYPSIHETKAMGKMHDFVSQTQKALRMESLRVENTAKVDDKTEDKLQLISQEYLPWKFYRTPGIETQVPKIGEPYLPPESSEVFSENEGEGYKYDKPSNELSLPSELNNSNQFEDKPSHVFPDPEKIPEDDSIEIIPQGSSPLETTWITKEGTQKSLQDPSDLTSSLEPYYQKEQQEPETYSSVQYTGSFFTAEGLPVLNTEMKFPVDYSFVYYIHGQPELGHQETRFEDTAKGSYWVELPDGRVQLVRYTAGPGGYKPSISYRNKEDPSLKRDLSIF